MDSFSSTLVTDAIQNTWLLLHGRKMS
jgi:hypothetical protein